MSQEDGTTKKREKLNLDRVLVEEVGQCGQFQFRIIALSLIVAFFKGFHSNLYLFTFAKVKSRCYVPECENRSSGINFTSPWTSDAIPAVGNTLDTCHRFETIANASDGFDESCPAVLFNRNSTVECQEYIYEHMNSAIFEEILLQMQKSLERFLHLWVVFPETYEYYYKCKNLSKVIYLYLSTTIFFSPNYSKYNLACDSWRPSMVGSIIFVGNILALFVGGFLADRWGRRITLAMSGFSLAFLGAMLYFAADYMSYTLIGVTSQLIGGSFCGVGYVLVIEFVGPKHRAVLTAALSTVSTIGMILTSAIGSTGLYWRNLILIIHCPMLVMILYYWLFPESIRWLMSKNRFEEAKEVLNNAASVNGNRLSEKTLQCFRDATRVEDKEKYKNEPWLICLIFKHKPVLLRCVVTPMCWFASNFVDCGIAITSTVISGNPFFNYCIVAAAATPGFWIATMLLTKIGRKPVMIVTLWICGACLLAFITIPEGNTWLPLVIYVMGKMTLSISRTTLTVYSAEIFPTRHRAVLFNFCWTVSAIGSTLAPLTPALAENIWKNFPFVAFGFLAFFSGFLMTLTPETFGASLPDTMEEAADLGRDEKPGFMSIFRRRRYIVQCCE